MVSLRMSALLMARHILSAHAADDCSTTGTCDAQWQNADAEVSESKDIQSQQVKLLQRNLNSCPQVGGSNTGKVINTFASKCLTVASWPVVPDAKVSQNDCKVAKNNAVWEWSADKYLALNTEQCLCVSVQPKNGGRSHPAAGDPIVLKRCGTAYTEWEWQEGSLGEGGRYMLKDRVGGELCIDPEGGMNLDDTPLVLQTCTKVWITDQKFTLPEKESQALGCAVPDGSKSGEIMDLFSKKVMAVSFPHKYADVWQKDRNAARYENTFSFHDTYLKLKFQGCWCLGVLPQGGDRSGPKANDKVKLKTCKEPWTQWEFMPATLGKGGRYKIMGAKDDLCIDPEGNMNSEDTNLVVSQCTKIAITDQKFTLPGDQ